MIRNVTATKTPGADFDAIVIGGGFGGLYAVHKLRNDQGLHVKAYDNASDVGGTWYWNRYPGALSDTESFCYGSVANMGHGRAASPSWGIRQHWRNAY